MIFVNLLASYIGSLVLRLEAGCSFPQRVGDEMKHNKLAGKEVE